MMYFPSNTNSWVRDRTTDNIQFTVDGKDDQMRKVERTYKVIVTKKYLENTYGIPDDSNAWEVAIKYYAELSDLAMCRASTGQHDENGNIQIG